VIESLDGIDRKSRGQTAIADFDPGGTIFVHPTGFPTAVFLLESERRVRRSISSRIPTGRASKDTHGESQSITFGSYPFLNALAEDRAKGKIGFCAFYLLEETSHEEQEAFRSGVVTGAVGIPPVYQDFSDPSESWGSS
jgi:hypothetical protein